MSRFSALHFAVLCLIGCVGCNGLFYFPSDRVYSIPRAKYRNVTFASEGGVRLHGWFFPPQTKTTPRGTIIQFHGNAENLTSHHRSLLWVTRYGYSLFVFDYRGYGRSSGTPTRAGLRADALAAIAWTLEQAPVGSAQPDLILYGQSLGGAVLLGAFGAIPERARIRALVIENSFHSYEEVAASVLWRSPILFPLTGLAYALVTEDDALAINVSSVSPIPLLIIHDRYDHVIPWRFGATLHELARPPKSFWLLERGGHSRAMNFPDVRGALLSWLDAADGTR
jgi:hypothetical protein